MNYLAITISREYGAGGGELGRLLADQLGWELLDRQLLHQAAAVEHVPDADLERLDEQAVSLVDRFRLHPPHAQYMHGLTEATRQAVQRGKVILVGRGTRKLLGETPGVLHLRLVAPKECRVQRKAQREGTTLDQALARCTAVDRTRQRFIRYFFGDGALQPSAYDLVANTGRVLLDDLVAVVAALVQGKPAVPSASTKGNVLTLSRELGTDATGLARTLGGRLGLRVIDRELLEQEAVRLGVPESDIEAIDEQPSGMFQRLRPEGLYQRYFEVLGKLMTELAARGEVLIVGRGGSRFLRDQPRAFHVRLVATMPLRIRRVMEHRWVREGPAQKQIADSDSQRARFFNRYFSADWADPLEYHLTVNTGRLGPGAVDLVAALAERYWQRAT